MAPVPSQEGSVACKLVGIARVCSHVAGVVQNQRLRVLHGTWQEGVLPGMVEARYASYTQGMGQKIRAGKVRPWFPPCRMPLLAISCIARCEPALVGKAPLLLLTPQM